MNETYVIKLNLSNLSFLNNSSNNLEQTTINTIFNTIINTSNITSNDFVFMNKDEYIKYILSNYGSYISSYTSDCSICNLDSPCPLYKLNQCNHVFHSSCIFKWFSQQSHNDCNMSCPLCRHSNELSI